MDLNVTALRLAAKQYRKEFPRVMTRIVSLLELAKRVKDKRVPSELDYERVALKFEIHSRTLRRWVDAYQVSGVKGLIPKKITGRPCRYIVNHPGTPHFQSFEI